jgi:hypothetical protein
MAKSSKFIKNNRNFGYNGTNKKSISRKVIIVGKNKKSPTVKMSFSRFLNSIIQRLKAFRLSTKLILIIAFIAILIIIPIFIFSYQSETIDSINTDVLVYGSSLGGASSAITLGESDIKTILISENSNIGGQAVDAGLSAFDESRRPWENNGIYKDIKTFIQTKYNLPPGTSLGNAVVGSLSALPSDIDAFFRQRITTNKNISLLQNNEIVEISKSNSSYLYAIVKDKQTGKKLKINFKYILDGTQTGKLYTIAGANYSVGIDSKESTGELSAMTDQIKNYFVNGVTTKTGLFGAFGNRTQAQIAFFSIYDKGYQGDFYSPDSIDSCWSTSGQGYVKNSFIYKSTKRDCSTNIQLNPGYSGQFEVYFINNKNSSINIEFYDQNNTRISIINKSINSAEQFIDLGSLNISTGTYTAKITANKEDYNLNGLILVKKDDSNSPLQQTTLNYESASRSGVWFSYTTPNGDKSFSAKGKSSLEWKYHSSSQGSNTFSLDWFPYLNRSQNISIDVIDVKANKVIFNTVISQRYKSRNDLVPLITFNTDIGDYKIKLSNNDISVEREMNIISASVTQNTNNVYQKISANTNNFVIPNVNGAYTIWAKPSKKGKITLSSGSLQNAASYDNKVFSSIGSYFLNSGDLIVNSEADAEIFITPINNNSFAYIQDLSKDSQIDISKVPKGKYRLSILSSSEINESDINLNSIKTYNFAKPDKTHLISEPFYINSDGQQLSINGLKTSRKYNIFIFEDLPVNYNVQYFSPDRKLFSTTSSSIPIYLQQNFFNYRNLISPTNFYNLNWPYKDWMQVGNNSLGLSIVGTPLNDYAPIYTNTIDSIDNQKNAKELSYAYYYWLKYDYPINQEYLGCDPSNTVQCTSKRIAISMNTFNTDDGFPLKNYIREGRRLNTINPIKEGDVSIAYINCTSTKCDNTNCITGTISDSSCISISQSPSIKSDALAAAFYQLDIHSFESRAEGSTFELSKFTNYLQTQKLIQSSDQFVFDRFGKAKASEITLGAIVPKDYSNLLPSSTNFGTTQITNSYFRTHNIEISVGESAGNLVAYLLKANISLKDFVQQNKVIDLQKQLIEKNKILYPIDDLHMDDTLGVRSVQFLILNGLLVPDMSILSEGSTLYKVYNGNVVNSTDQAILDKYAQGIDQTSTNQKLLIKVFDLDPNSTIDQVFQKAVEIGMFDNLQSSTGKTILGSQITKDFLYKSVYLKIK